MGRNPGVPEMTVPKESPAILRLPDDHTRTVKGFKEGVERDLMSKKPLWHAGFWGRKKDVQSMGGGILLCHERFGYHLQRDRTGFLFFSDGSIDPHHGLRRNSLHAMGCVHMFDYFVGNLTFVRYGHLERAFRPAILTVKRFHTNGPSVR
jgi:hypothetical protein